MKELLRHINACNKLRAKPDIDYLASLIGVQRRQAYNVLAKLVQQGLIRNDSYSVWVLTDAGREACGRSKAALQK